jgi:hypothetical protein
VRAKSCHRIVPATAFLLPVVERKVMSVGRLRAELNLLTEFTMAIAGAFMLGLPMALAIIWLLK